ncbi:MAG: hypothetical protein ABIJ43_05275 [Candidatus Beckwithbacteria bacterium]
MVKEILSDSATYIAPCEQESLVNLFYKRGGYKGRQCRECEERNPVYKVLSLSPKGEVEGSFGPNYYCKTHVPNIHQVVASQGNYCDQLFGSLKK